MQTTLSLPQNISTIFWLVCLIFISFEDLEDLSNGEDTGCLCDRRETKSLKKVIVFSAFTLLGYKSATASACNCMEEWDRYEGTSVSEQVGPCPKPDIYLLPRRRVLYLIWLLHVLSYTIRTNVTGRQVHVIDSWMTIVTALTDFSSHHGWTAAMKKYELCKCFLAQFCEFRDHWVSS